MTEIWGGCRGTEGKGERGEGERKRNRRGWGWDCTAQRALGVKEEKGAREGRREGAREGGSY